MNIEAKLSEKIIEFLEKETYFNEPLRNNDIDFSIKKITSVILADEILNHMLDKEELSKYQEWDIVRSNQITEMKMNYESLNNKSTFELDSEIFKYLGRKLNGKSIKDKTIDEKVPTLMDSLFDDFLYIIFNDYSNMNNHFFNNLLQVYLAGGWPCGWEGEYPEGRLVVFSNE